MCVRKQAGLWNHRRTTLLLLHHLNPPLEWQRAVCVLKDAVQTPEELPLGKEPIPQSIPQPLSAIKLQKLLRDLQCAVYEGYLERMALAQQAALHHPTPNTSSEDAKKKILSSHGAQQWEQQQRLLSPTRPSGNSYPNVPRLFAAVPQAASFLGLLPSPEWQMAVTGFADLGDMSFADFFDLTAPEQSAKLHCFIRYCCCMAAAVDAFHTKCVQKGLSRFAFAPPHLAFTCCKDTSEQEVVRLLSLLLEEEVSGLLARRGTTPYGPATTAATLCKQPEKLRDPRAPSSSQSNGSEASFCGCGACSSYVWRSSVIAAVPQRGAPPCERPWPLSFPCCFVLRCLRISRAQAGISRCSSESVAMQRQPLLVPEVVQEVVEGGGIPCSEALDIRADFANKVIGGGILYHGCLQEEVFFALCPELLLLRPLSQHLSAKEAAHCRGSLRFSNFSGYARTFRCRLNGGRNTGKILRGDPSKEENAQGKREREVAQPQGHGEAASTHEEAACFADQQPLGESNAMQGDAQAPRKRQVLLPLDSDDEEEDSGCCNRQHTGNTVRDTGWRGWGDGVEGVEAVDHTPIRVQWGTPRRGLYKGLPGRRPRRQFEPQTVVETPDEESEENCSGYSLLRIEIASVVTALDARRFGSPRAARRAAAADEILGVRGLMHGSNAAAKEVLHPSCQFQVPLMLRELQKVCAALHLPREEVLEPTAGAASYTVQAARPSKERLLRPFTTGNWGCGCFGGDPQLKFLLQWLGSSLSGRRMRYFAWGVPELLEDSRVSRLVSAVLEGGRWDCAKLWKLHCISPMRFRYFLMCADIAGSRGSCPLLREMGAMSYVLHRAAGNNVPSIVGEANAKDCGSSSSRIKHPLQDPAFYMSPEDCVETSKRLKTDVGDTTCHTEEGSSGPS
ncbi:putative poly(ADP-ribose) glycohydrolase [Cyclospora cayetanensis]|uniref:Poly(ADP-ribose) glycohydrolase n=1 Tax=Cyclospora cayetanensis TaxID=88456 RepID=A0A1D3CY54_9EIME|nr:putative poly(ADP-ribose) glycohydrolase [Cyclospora cayetanensis]